MDTIRLCVGEQMLLFGRMPKPRSRDSQSSYRTPGPCVHASVVRGASWWMALWLCLMGASAGMARQSADSGGASSTDQNTPTTAPALLNTILQPTGSAPLAIYPAVTTPPMEVVGAPVPTTQITLVPEGTYLLDRTGRFSLSADGKQLSFTLDYNGMPLTDAPLTVQPNLERVR